MARIGRGMPRGRDRAFEVFARFCGGGADAGCDGLRTLCGEGYLPACARVAGVCKGADVAACRPPDERSVVLGPVDELRRTGRDQEAVRELEVLLAREPSARIHAELGLAYEGAGRSVLAESNIEEALKDKRDAWVGEARKALELALQLIQSRVGSILFECPAPGATAVIVGSTDAPAPCGKPWQVVAGDSVVEVRAPGRRSARKALTVKAGAWTRLAIGLEPYTCELPAMIHMGAVGGGCCWPGQSWVDGLCAGRTDCPEGTMASGETCLVIASAPVRGPHTFFRVGLLGGLTGFFNLHASEFGRPVDATQGARSSTPRGELRVGVRLYKHLGLDLVAGGVKDSLYGTYSSDTVGLDFGAILQVHRTSGVVDVRLGAGVRPFARVPLDSTTAGAPPATLTATVVPLELGVSFLLGRSFSFDLLGQAAWWLPRSYCTSSSEVSACPDASTVSWELSWSALAGISVHLGE